MKTVKFLIFTLFLITSAQQVHAQDKGSIRASVDGLYVRGLREGGINLGAEYFISPKLSAAPSYSYFFVGGDGSHSQINLDARYYFVKGPIQLYALGGLAGFAQLPAWEEFGDRKV